MFTTRVSQICERAEAESDEFVVNRVEFAEGGNVEKRVAEERHVSLKGAARGYEATDETGEGRISNLNSINPAS